MRFIKNSRIPYDFMSIDQMVEYSRINNIHVNEIIVRIGHFQNTLDYLHNCSHWRLHYHYERLNYYLIPLNNTKVVEPVHINGRISSVNNMYGITKILGHLDFDDE